MTISEPVDIKIDKQCVLHNTGYSADSKLSPRIASLIDEYIENACHLIEPSYSCVTRDIKSVYGSWVVIEGSIIFQSEVLARLLEQCPKTAVFLVTIGNHLEEMVWQLTKDGLMLQATVLDAIGSVAAEKLADFVQGRVNEMARTWGLYTSRRFSPGYCDWNISQQKILFWAINGASMGIRLTPACLMLPQKSISGIIGIGPSDVESYNACKTCNKNDCPGRR